MTTPSEDDLFFDAAGWWRNDRAGRYELDVNGEAVAVVSFDEVRLAKWVDSYESIDRIIEQAADLREKLLSTPPNQSGSTVG